MIRDDLRALEQLLSAGDGLRADGSSRPASSAATRAVAEMRSVASALARGCDEPKHFTLEELQDYVDGRRALGDRWQMPEHLAQCGLCLEAFELLLAGAPKLSAAALDRFVGLKELPSEQMPVVKLPRRSPRLWRYTKLLAAAAVLLVAGLWVLGGSKPVHVRSGTVAIASGEPAAPDRSLPQGKHLVAEKPTEASFDDGSEMSLAAGSKFVLRARSAWRTVVELEDGTADFTVAKQPAYRQFRVHTGLGDVIVVGTRFRVTTGKQEVEVFRNTQAAGVPVASRENRQIMVVTVEEGRVRVKNTHEEITLTAGQKATVREDQPKIDVAEGT